MGTLTKGHAIGWIVLGLWSGTQTAIALLRLEPFGSFEWSLAAVGMLFCGWIVIFGTVQLIRTRRSERAYESKYGRGDGESWPPW